MSIAGGPANALIKGRSIACDTIQMFTRGPNRWKAKPLSGEEIAAFHVQRAETGIYPVIAHSSYLINLASPDEALRERSLAALIEELGRCEQLCIEDYVLHPGSHRGTGEAEGLQRIAEGLRCALEASPQAPVRILLETTAGQGDGLGHTFEQLAWLCAEVGGAEVGGTEGQAPDRLGVCFDTAHALAAGYDFRDASGYAATWAHFDAVIGISRLHAIHLNDSKRDVGSNVDRHEQIGQGHVGLDAFRFLVNDGRLRRVPMILETPKGPDLKEDVANLALLRSLVGRPAPSGTECQA
ncbi:MAG: deoxyribonuclease IV [Anaerolineae bacterium]|nr:deoxyribonuclease IV [Anaerolineae bacterium]